MLYLLLLLVELGPLPGRRLPSPPGSAPWAGCCRRRRSAAGSTRQSPERFSFKMWEIDCGQEHTLPPHLSIDVAAELDEEPDDVEVPGADGVVQGGDALVVRRRRIGNLEKKNVKHSVSQMYVGLKKMCWFTTAWLLTCLAVVLTSSNSPSREASSSRARGSKRTWRSWEVELSFPFRFVVWRAKVIVYQYQKSQKSRNTQ